MANGLLRAVGAPAAARFDRALDDPAGAQAAILHRVLARDRASAFGRAHGFDRIRSLADYRRRVPVRTFDELRPWIDRVAGGERAVLTADRVDWLEPSGGSSGASKLVPFTRSLRRELAAATLPWLVDLQRTRPALQTGTAYWAISPPARLPARTSGGVRIGAAGDGDYFPRRVRPALRGGLAVGPEVAAAGDLAACRRATLRGLLAAEDLTFVSVWSPSFLTRLAEALDEDWPALRRARRGLPAAPPEDLGELWPRLDLISCWTDAAAARALPALRRRFPGVEVQGKGLLATEGVVTIPLAAAPAPVAAVRSHHLELLADGEAHLLSEVDVGGVYEVVLTTGGGLHRYRLGDLVRVEGRLRATPLLRFVGRADGRVDLAGEKLAPAFAEAALAAAQARTGVAPAFALLSPRADGRGYVLTLEAEPAWAGRRATAAAPALPAGRARPATPARSATAAGTAATVLAAALDTELAASTSYRLARELGQLEPVSGRAVPGAERAWEAACLARGQRAGAIKPTVLDRNPFEEDLLCAP